MDLVRIQSQCVEDTKEYFPEMPDKGLGNYLALCLAGEVGEVCNDIKKLLRGDFTLADFTDRIGPELADVLIYLVLLAEEFGIDLEGEYHDKREVNNDRFLS